MSDLSSAEISQLTALLKRLEPGFVPYPIFEQIARIAALPVVEVIPLRLNQNGEAEVLLIDRGPNDPLWPNLLHTPGTIVRASDMHFGETHDHKAFERIFQDELKGTAVGKPHHFGDMFHKSKRGAEQAQLYWVEVTGEPSVGAFYPTNDLPNTLIDSQIAFITQAANHFKRHKQS